MTPSQYLRLRKVLTDRLAEVKAALKVDLPGDPVWNDGANTMLRTEERFLRETLNDFR